MTRAKLVELYINQRLTTKQLGAAIGVSQPTAVRYLKAWRIPARKSGNAPATRCPKCGAQSHKWKDFRSGHPCGSLCYQHFRERENSRIHKVRRRRNCH